MTGNNDLYNCGVFTLMRKTTSLPQVKTGLHLNTPLSCSMFPDVFQWQVEESQALVVQI